MLNKFFPFFLLSLLLFMPINFSSLSNYRIMNVIIYEDGWNEVNYVISNINSTFLDINIAKDAEFLIVLDPFGEPLDYELYDGKITVYCENMTGIKVTYYTQSFTSKDSEGIWTFNLLTDANETNILLPKYSTILGFEETPFKIGMENEMILLSFNSKKISFHYIIEAPIVLKTKTTYTTTILTNSSEILTTYFKTETRIFTQTIFNKTTIITSLITYPFTETIKEATIKNEAIFNLNLFYIIFPIIIAIVIIIIFLLKKRREAISYYLTEEENAIIDILKKRGGVYQSELIEILNLPKTTVWRHLKRLEKMGKIKIIKKENKNYIVLE